MVRSFGTLNLFTYKLSLWSFPLPTPDTMLIFMHITKPQCLNFVLGGGGGRGGGGGAGNGMIVFSLKDFVNV